MGEEKDAPFFPRKIEGARASLRRCAWRGNGGGLGVREGVGTGGARSEFWELRRPRDRGRLLGFAREVGGDVEDAFFVGGLTDWSHSWGMP